ncbi:MAG: sodium-dependent transporter [Rhodothalassiaceae bacterium]
MATAAHENWSSRSAFILAAIGSAVGLGNVWGFPFEAGAGGGGAFVLIYLAFVFAIGWPVMVAELALGRRGHLAPPNAVAKVAREAGRSTAWSVIGWLGVIGAFLVLSFYSVVAGWTLSYMVDAFVGTLNGFDGASSVEHFTGLIASPALNLLWHTIFMGITILVVARGINDGLEQAVTWLMPALFVLLVGLVFGSLIVGDASAAVDFLFKPDFSKVTITTVIKALGQAFFSLSLGLGAILAYGAYVPREVSLSRSALIICSADTAVAMLAGLAVFPIVFRFGLDAAAGPGLVFITLPIAFAQMPLGWLFGGAFFLLLAVAALTSAISLLEPSVAWLEENRGLSRIKAGIGAGVAVFLVGLASAFSQDGNLLASVKPFGVTILDFLDNLTKQYFIPIGGLFISIFVGWRLSRATMRDELALFSERGFQFWRFMIRYACPVALAIVFISVAFFS